jgi:hypothetical protein
MKRASLKRLSIYLVCKASKSLDHFFKILRYKFPSQFLLEFFHGTAEDGYGRDVIEGGFGRPNFFIE